MCAFLAVCFLRSQHCPCVLSLECQEEEGVDDLSRIFLKCRASLFILPPCGSPVLLQPNSILTIFIVLLHALGEK